MSDQVVSLVLRVPAEIRDKLRQLADDDARSVNFIANRMLAKSLEAGEKKEAA